MGDEAREHRRTMIDPIVEAISESEVERESIQSAMNMVRAVLFGDSSILSGAIKDEPTRLLIAEKLNRLDLAIENGLNTAMRSGQSALSQERQLREEAERDIQRNVDAAVAIEQRAAREREAREDAEARVKAYRELLDDVGRYLASSTYIGDEHVSQRLEAGLAALDSTPSSG